ncbi:hypothetical protein AB0L44_39630 [Nonomuraea wenchangensis]|uniref:hypothetical protein n=1 Tax=Nonomuraea wenchangensis TaxID=568860 RepID=UPI00344193CD
MTLGEASLLERLAADEESVRGQLESLRLAWPPRHGSLPSAGEADDKLFPKSVISGWADAVGIRIRQARTGDLPAMVELVPLAGVRIEDVLREAVTERRQRACAPRSVLSRRSRPPR